MLGAPTQIRSCCVSRCIKLGRNQLYLSILPEPTSIFRAEPIILSTSTRYEYQAEIDLIIYIWIHYTEI